MEESMEGWKDKEVEETKRLKTGRPNANSS
jgi:hypothetical protein